MFMNVPAFFKPSSHILFQRYVDSLQSILSFRPLSLDFDSDLLSGWVNQVYTQRFWQLDGPVSQFREGYLEILSNPNAHSFVGQIEDQIVCQVDLYRVQADELASHVNCAHNDCGLHLLMCPPKQMQRGWSLAALQCFQDFYFGYPEAGNLYAEPDHQNHQANRLAIQAGFTFLRPVVLSYKTANLYMLAKEKYYTLRNLS